MASITLTTTAAEDARLAPAFGAYLHPGTNATVADIKAWMVAQMVQVVKNYEQQQAVAALVPSTPIAPT